jgi:hypothetical protein
MKTVSGVFADVAYAFRVGGGSCAARTMAADHLSPAAIKAVTDLIGRAAATVWNTGSCRLRGGQPT